MNFMSMWTGLLGYWLCYCAVANGGRFATQPWLAFMADAYAPEGAPFKPWSFKNPGGFLPGPEGPKPVPPGRQEQ